MSFTLEPTAGGAGGAHIIIKYQGRFVGYFYPDYENYDDVELFEKILTGDKPQSERK